MRATLVALLAVTIGVAGLLAWATLARVPEAGALHAWDPATGELAVPEAGFGVYPRWRWHRFTGTELEARVSAPAEEGGTVEARLRWRPATGSYPLAPGEEPAAGFAARVAESARAALSDLPVGCLLEEREMLPDCPAEPGAGVAAAAGASIGVDAGRIRVALQADPEAVRAHVLASIAAGLPGTGRRVLVLGLDGLDWDLVLPWARQGRMPNLARLLATGTWGTLETLVPTLSPLIWTTIATGVAPDRHGILDFVERDPARNVMVPVTGRNRRVPALWNLASALGREVAVVGWWGSWPAERVRGVVVSDRLYYTLTQGLTREVLREDLPDLVYPAERTAELVELRDRAVAETDWRAVRYFMRVPEARFAAAVAAERGMDDPVDGFRRMLAATRTYLGAGLALATAKPDLAMVYLEGTDTIGHLLAPYVAPPTLDVDPDEAALLVEAVPRYFEVVDRWLGRYLESYPLSEHTWLVVSDHGFKWSAGRPRGVSGTAGPTAPLWHELDAVFLAAGPGVERRGRVEEPASVYDLAPTVAALLGLPADAGWPGSPLPGCPAATLAPIDYAPLVPPESYRQEGGGVAPIDPEALAKLEALGYLGGGRSAGGTTTGTPPDAALEAAASRPSRAPAEPRPSEPAAPSTTRGELNNLAILRIQEKRYDEAEALLRRAIAQSPDYPSPHFNLRRIYMETGRYDEADRELWLAVDKGLRDTERTIDKAAADYEDLDLVERAATVLARAVERYPAHEPFWVHLMVVRIRLEQCAAARDLGREAANRFPESAPVHAFYGLSAACAGDVATARTALERSLALNPDQATLRRTLADLGK